MEDVAPGEGKVPGLKEVRNAEGEGMGKDRSKEGEKEVFSMAGVNLAIPKGSLTAIVGSVGCGKSSLLQGTFLSLPKLASSCRFNNQANQTSCSSLPGLIGEMARTSGDVVFNGSIGYVPQNAWLASATIRDNILFGRPFDEERYWGELDLIVYLCSSVLYGLLMPDLLVLTAAVRAASLEADLETLPGGDGTAIGEKGINLSGGQRQRVSYVDLSSSFLVSLPS
jgi:ABC-type transport system involved in cytochrome bd biosynthesis fused ATPase/permease subunit